MGGAPARAEHRLAPGDHLRVQAPQLPEAHAAVGAPRRSRGTRGRRLPCPRRDVEDAGGEGLPGSVQLVGCGDWDQSGRRVEDDDLRVQRGRDRERDGPREDTHHPRDGPPGATSTHRRREQRANTQAGQGYTAVQSHPDQLHLDRMPLAPGAAVEAGGRQAHSTGLPLPAKDPPGDNDAPVQKAQCEEDPGGRRDRGIDPAAT
mmetsp:Transcript_27303/g.66415  ORF Transcript_27303/g.66415 Transcript_27303/m.66415 type:complete len:204 (+) Transcript_27303:431-1042(+)